MNDRINVNTDAVLPEAVENIENGGEKMFTQSQLEEIISERLGRERRVNESLKSVKQVLLGAVEKGLIKGDSYAEMADELVKKLKDASGEEKECAAEKETDTQDVAADFQITSEEPESDGVNVTNDGNDGIKETEDDDGGFISTLAYLKSSYPEKNLTKLLSGDLFERFAKGKSGSVKEILCDFFCFADALSERSENREAPSHSDIASTAFSSESGAPADFSGLTPRQMEIAKNSGMSYREYAYLLESIPKNKGRTF